MQDIQTKNHKVKLHLFVDNMLLYVQNPKDSKKCVKANK